MMTQEHQDIHAQLIEFVARGYDWENHDGWWDKFAILHVDIVRQAGGDEALDDDAFVKEIGDALLGSIFKNAEKRAAYLATQAA